MKIRSVLYCVTPCRTRRRITPRWRGPRPVREEPQLLHERPPAAAGEPELAGAPHAAPRAVARSDDDLPRRELVRARTSCRSSSPSRAAECSTAASDRRHALPHVSHRIGGMVLPAFEKARGVALELGGDDLLARRAAQSPRPTDGRHAADQPLGRVPLMASNAVAIIGGEAVMEVVIALAERQQRRHHAVPRRDRDRVGAPAERVGERIHEERRVMDEHGAEDTRPTARSPTGVPSRSRSRAARTKPMKIASGT